MSTANEIRQQYLDFFRSKGHVIVPSAPIVIKNDPTLLFTNAGMNQFKDYFLGNKPAPSKRVANTQKCLRVSGKHNDLEEVGVDTYHHTMFEMLGNWSFGDYFKKEAIEWSWELLTEVYKIPKEQLYVTVFEGDEKEGLPRDEEAIKYWKQFVPDDRIIMGNKKDNFWEMGDTGPCGPCTEIHVDCRTVTERADGKGASFVNADHPQVIEIWNNVFMQFNRLKDGSLQPLPAQHVDTGMGFERLVRVLQHKQSNYDTDVFTGTIASTEQITGKKYDYSDSKEAIAFRVIADHIRAITFTIADGQLPSNTGAGYVIRRILRRAVRYAFSYLNYKQPLLNQLMPVLAKQFENVFPELMQQLDFVKRVVHEEEEAFLRTLGRGLQNFNLHLEKEIIEINRKLTEDGTLVDVTKGEKHRKDFNGDEFKKMRVIDGQFAFELYDTYGFPLDLTRLIAIENHFEIDEEAFNAAMQQQKSRSRAATALDTEDWVVLKEGTTKFVGYDSTEAQAEVLRYRKVTAKGKESYQIILSETPFYAESGGQVGDTGELIFPDETIQIINTKKENDLIIHFSEVLPANVNELTGNVLAKIDDVRRAHTTIHHSATHLLHAALREVLGKHVAQKGSLVNDDQLRFDFSHFAKMTAEEIAQVEKIVNQKIRANVPVTITSMSKDEAIKMGATALFGEKYGDIVRVVVMDPNYSIELCGGTHVGFTGELGFFKIKHESAVAAGIRRIEAVSGAAAENFINAHLDELHHAKELLKNPKDFGKSIENLLEEQALLKKKAEALENKLIAAQAVELLTKATTVNGINFLGMRVESTSLDALKKLTVDVKNNLQNAVVVLCANIGGKPSVAISISDNLVAEKQLDATKMIKEIVAPLIKGGGGGQKALATAGGQDAGKLNDVIEQIQAGL